MQYLHILNLDYHYSISYYLIKETPIFGLFYIIFIILYLKYYVDYVEQCLDFKDDQYRMHFLSLLLPKHFETKKIISRLFAKWSFEISDPK
jgi:hypothetical protein